jgi:alpha-glucosidase
LGPALSPGRLQKVVGPWLEPAASQSWPSWAFSNHDVARPTERLAAALGADAADDSIALLCFALGMTMRGTYFVYQGEELGLPQVELPLEALKDPFDIAAFPDGVGRDGARVPLPWKADAAHFGFNPEGSAAPWLPQPESFARFAVDAQEGRNNSTLKSFRDLMSLRKEHPVLRDGSMHILDAPEPLFVFERGGEDDGMLCVFNLSGEERVFEVPEGFKLRWLHLSEGGIASSQARLTLPPRSFGFGMRS